MNREALDPSQGNCRKRIKGGGAEIRQQNQGIGLGKS
jgi:hypothetical protein